MKPKEPKQPKSKYCHVTIGQLMTRNEAEWQSLSYGQLIKKIEEAMKLKLEISQIAAIRASLNWPPTKAMEMHRQRRAASNCEVTRFEERLAALEHAITRGRVGRDAELELQRQALVGQLQQQVEELQVQVDDLTTQRRDQIRRHNDLVAEVVRLRQDLGDPVTVPTPGDGEVGNGEAG